MSYTSRVVIVLVLLVLPLCWYHLVHLRLVPEPIPELWPEHTLEREREATPEPEVIATPETEARTKATPETEPTQETEPTLKTEPTPETLAVTSEFEYEIKDKSVLPPRVISGVNTFVFFLAYSRSGHSIVASLMDSHPHMVVSHEFDLFTKLVAGYLAPNKSEIFNPLWKNTRKSIINDGLRAESTNIKGYT